MAAYSSASKEGGGSSSSWDLTWKFIPVQSQRNWLGCFCQEQLLVWFFRPLIPSRQVSLVPCWVFSLLGFFPATCHMSWEGDGAPGSEQPSPVGPRRKEREEGAGDCGGAGAQHPPCSSASEAATQRADNKCSSFPYFHFTIFSSHLVRGCNLCSMCPFTTHYTLNERRD